ncbi:hypothetical protein K8I85_17935 [bacterium]|nr:hypothetical protein [bacterium]
MSERDLVASGCRLVPMHAQLFLLVDAHGDPAAFRIQMETGEDYTLSLPRTPAEERPIVADILEKVLSAGESGRWWG